ncbi:sensor domain-containing protein [Mycobacterium sp. SMC-4]|uniref:sensor domain-containing protein n=1 Tax=Mycobacterium sp. SMC-4 TaxID=2857059 RepID=UPI003CFE81EB
MTPRGCASARRMWRYGRLLAVVAVVAVGCTHAVGGMAVRSAPLPDENSQSPVDVDAVLLDRRQMQALTGAGEDLTPIPGMESKAPVDIDHLRKSVPAQCTWLVAETEVFGGDVEEFHKTTFQNPPDGALISQAAAGYRSADVAREAFGGLVGSIQRCRDSDAGPAMVGPVTTTVESVRTRPGGCGRDYRLKSAVLIEVTFCAFSDAVSEVVMANIVANVPG